MVNQDFFFVTYYLLLHHCEIKQLLSCCKSSTSFHSRQLECLHSTRLKGPWTCLFRQWALQPRRLAINRIISSPGLRGTNWKRHIGDIQNYSCCQIWAGTKVFWSIDSPSNWLKKAYWNAIMCHLAQGTNGIVAVKIPMRTMQSMLSPWLFACKFPFWKFCSFEKPLDSFKYRILLQDTSSTEKNLTAKVAMLCMLLTWTCDNQNFIQIAVDPYPQNTNYHHHWQQDLQKDSWSY